ncbi:MAG: Abi-alpha family protein, partial [Marinomonas sp.]
LAKDQISYWRFNNQIRILNKAKALCDKNSISVKSIPVKLFCPYLEYASLEDDDELQDKWAILLANMVDSQQNIQNHVFPYIMSQLSKDEFNLLESAYVNKFVRVSNLNIELKHLVENRTSIEESLNLRLSELEQKLSTYAAYEFSQETRELRSAINTTNQEINRLKVRDIMIKSEISAPEEISECDIKAFEMANIVRLGLAKVTYEVSAGTHSIEVPSEYSTVDFDVEIETDTTTILTELGELFLKTCREQLTSEKGVVNSKST